jgi:GDPmannose 4,6-dehydratase
VAPLKSRSASHPRRSALIVGVGGQDGSYLAEFLLALGYQVFGVVRPSTAQLPERIAHLAGSVEIIRADLSDESSLRSIFRQMKFDEVYNMASISFVPDSWRTPTRTAESAAMGAAHLLEAIRRTQPAVRFCQASSSEIFGSPQEAPQNEGTPYAPRNPYGVSKLFGHLMTEQYREGFGMFASSAILYNHESPRRDRCFVTRKITHAAAAISLGRATSLALGNLHDERDWGFAGDYVKAMWLMLQQVTPASCVVATGELHSVEEVLDTAFEHVDLDWHEYVREDLSLLRPLEEVRLVGDAGNARAMLGWQAEIGLEELIRLMVDADLARLDDQREYSPSYDWPRGGVESYV